MKRKRDSRYKIKRDLAYDGCYNVYEGDVKLSGHLSRSNAEQAVERYEAADRRRGKI